MNPNHRTIGRRLLPSALALVLASPVALCYAQPAPPAPPSRMEGPHGPDHGPMRGPGGRHMMRDVERLKTSLRLDPKQTALWERAADRMKVGAEGREQMKTRRDRMTALLDDPNFDPRKLVAEMDGQSAERDAQRKNMRDAWIDVYESLNPVQRGQVREFMRSHLAQGPFMHRPAQWMHRDGPRPPETPAAAPQR